MAGSEIRAAISMVAIRYAPLLMASILPCELPSFLYHMCRS